MISEIITFIFFSAICYDIYFQWIIKQSIYDHNLLMYETINYLELDEMTDDKLCLIQNIKENMIL